MSGTKIITEIGEVEFGVNKNAKMIDNLTKRKFVSYTTKSLGLAGVLAGDKFYTYIVDWKLGPLTGSFEIDTYYGGKGKKYIKAELARQIRNKIEEFGAKAIPETKEALCLVKEG